MDLQKFNANTFIWVAAAIAGVWVAAKLLGFLTAMLMKVLWIGALVVAGLYVYRRLTGPRSPR